MGTSIIKNSDIVQILEPTVTQNEYNSQETSWASPTVVATGRASIQHFMANEDDIGRQTTTEGLRLISDDPALLNAIEPTHRIRYAGEDYEVDGAIQAWRFFGRLHHIEVYLRRVEG